MKLYNIIATNKINGESLIEKYDFSAAGAYTWIKNNEGRQPAWDFTTEETEESISKHEQYGEYQNNGGTMDFEQWELDGRYDPSFKTKTS